MADKSPFRFYMGVFKVTAASPNDAQLNDWFSIIGFNEGEEWNPSATMSADDARIESICQKIMGTGIVAFAKASDSTSYHFIQSGYQKERISAIKLHVRALEQESREKVRHPWLKTDFYNGKVVSAEWRSRFTLIFYHALVVGGLLRQGLKGAMEYDKFVMEVEKTELVRSGVGSIRAKTE
jgi:hypothetical protein